MEIIYIFKILNKSCDMHVSIDAVIDHWSFWLLIQLMHRNKLKRHMLLIASKIFSKPKSQTLTNTMFSGVWFVIYIRKVKHKTSSKSCWMVSILDFYQNKKNASQCFYRQKWILFTFVLVFVQLYQDIDVLNK